MAPVPADSAKGRVQVLSEIVNSDLTAARNEYFFRTPFLVTTLSPLLKDQRDLPMLCLQLNIAEALVPGALLIYGINMWEPALPAITLHLAGLVYLICMFGLFLERFILMLHFASHRSIFHNEMLNGMLIWLVAPFFGIPAGVYKVHHVIMHHIENNHELDISSTERFQRDSWLDFASYWFHFVFLIWVELPYYAFRTKRYEQCWSLVAGIMVYVGFSTILARYVNFVATLWVFIIPYFVAMSAMAFGNWSQHIFINPEDSTSNYALTYNCIDTKGNQTTFNDGYHIVHHANARLHWSEMPDCFYKTQDKHQQGGAMTFRGVHFFDVGVLVMTKQLHKLAEHYVHLGNEDDAPTKEAIEAKLRAWLQPVRRQRKET